MKWYLIALKKFAVFSGRARRKEYWYFVLFSFITIFLLSILTTITNDVSNLAEVSVFSSILQIFMLLIIVPGFAVTVRRLHDIGKSGWFCFIVLIPFGNFWLLFTMTTAGDKGPNKYGPDPKNQEAASSSSILDENI